MLYGTVPRPGLRPIGELQGLSGWRWGHWLAGEGLAVCVDPQGRVVMFCGTTYSQETPRGARVSLSKYTSNSIVWFDSGNFGVGYGIGFDPTWKAPNPVFPNYWVTFPTLAGFRWPSGAWVDTATDGKVHVMVTGYAGSVFTSYSPDRLDEYVLNAELVPVSSVQVPGLQPTTVGGNRLVWGVAVFTDGDWTYIFGVWNRPMDGERLVVARRAAILGSQPGNTPTFWDGASWVTDVNSVAELGPTPGASGGLVVRDGSLMFISCRKGSLTNRIAAWSAPAVTGPWTDLGDLYTIPTEFDAQFSYGGVPYLVGHRLRVLYNVSSTSVDVLKGDYRRFGIRWVELVL